MSNIVRFLNSLDIEESAVVHRGKTKLIVPGGMMTKLRRQYFLRANQHQMIDAIGRDLRTHLKLIIADLQIQVENIIRDAVYNTPVETTRYTSKGPGADYEVSGKQWEEYKRTNKLLKMVRITLRYYTLSVNFDEEANQYAAFVDRGHRVVFPVRTRRGYKLVEPGIHVTGRPFIRRILSLIDQTIDLEFRSLVHSYMKGVQAQSIQWMQSGVAREYDVRVPTAAKLRIPYLRYVNQ